MANGERFARVAGMKRSVFILLGFGVVLSGCLERKVEMTASGGEPAVAGAERGDWLRIAVVPKGTTHTFWKTVHAGAKKGAAETGAELLWKGPVGEGDREGQIKVVENFVTQGVDAIALAPLDDVALVRPVKEASDDGIPVVIWDSGLSEAGDGAFGSFVATDNFIAGEKCGRKMAELLGGKGKVMMLRYEVGSASTQKREDGFMKGLKEAGPEIEVVSSDQYAGGTVEKAQESANNLLNQFGDVVDGIYTPNESATEGMLLAVRSAGLAGKVKFVGFDSNSALVAGIEAGELHALALQDPFNMGYLAVKAAVALVKGEAVEARVDTGSVWLTKENMGEAAMQALLNPEI